MAAGERQVSSMQFDGIFLGRNHQFAIMTCLMEPFQCFRAVFLVVGQKNLGLQVNAGHGLNRQNINDIASLSQLRELNIGHAIIADSVFMGLEASVREYKRLMLEARI